MGEATGPAAAEINGVSLSPLFEVFTAELRALDGSEVTVIWDIGHGNAAQVVSGAVAAEGLILFPLLSLTGTLISTSPRATWLWSPDWDATRWLRDLLTAAHLFWQPGIRGRAGEVPK